MNATYAYIYDDFLSDRRFERDVAALENALNTYDMAGQIGRLALFRSAKDLVTGCLDGHVTTIVLVGNDATLDKTMWFLPDLGVTIGYIPLAGPSAVADALGIPVGIRACDVLAARSIESLDMGRLDDRYFLTEVLLPATRAGIEVDGRYTVSPREGGAVSVRNLGGVTAGAALEPADAHDGYLDIVITPRERERKHVFFHRHDAGNAETRLRLREGLIMADDPVTAYVDNHVVNGFSFRLAIAPEALRLITGRRRLRATDSPLQRAKKGGNLRPVRTTLPRGGQKPATV